MADLDAEQARRLERVLRRRGNVVCPKCGSADYLESNGVWMRNIAGRAIVAVICHNPNAEGHPQKISPSPQLSAAEAQEVGINPR